MLLSNTIWWGRYRKAIFDLQCFKILTGLLAHSSFINQRNNEVYHKEVVSVTLKAGEFLYLLHI